ncbi:ApaLI family restriction endonuclease [Mannheimia indoligenes]|uniref:ApaLI family restriction endonuclease n=1 Tax=Mannheimia indoligenes TaxID=3103145 RepID=UPI002FE512EF
MILLNEIRALAKKYEQQLSKQIHNRTIEMQNDDTSHHLIYRVLGISHQEGELIDLYQNKGRFLYKYAGAFLEEAAFMCIKYAYPDTHKVKIPNTLGVRPKTFEIDALVNEQFAFEIKWRDATTDGDHITKEHTRLNVIHQAGFKPIRLMFYYPNRTQAQKIQETLCTLYVGLNGEYYYADSAWHFIHQFTGIDLLTILQTIASEKQNAV